MSGSVAARALEEGDDGGKGRAALEEEVSMAFSLPRAMTGTAGTRPRRPLSSEDAALIRKVIALQDRGSFNEADRMIGALQSNLLHGTILAQRLRLSPDMARADAVAWLAEYGAEADAPEIRRLLSVLDHEPILRQETFAEAAVPRPDAVRNLFAANHDGAAMRAAASRYGCRAPACFAAGLAAWRAQRYEVAQVFFNRAADDPGADAGTQAAGLFWSARVLQMDRRDGAALAQLRRAAAFSGSFYGLLAGRLLVDGGVPLRPGSLLSDGDLDSVEALPVGRRALALLQVGATDWALAALRHFLAGSAPGQRPSRAVVRSVALLARDIEFTRRDGPAEVPSLALAAIHLPAAPREGYAVDPALLYALIRVESNFQPDVVSHRGARGLMQIMPITATYLLDGPGVVRRNIRFDDPAINVDLGQRYLRYLARHEAIQGNLIRLLASYNIGGGGFARIEKTIRAGDDPLLFIEAIPKDETRSFVQRVLAFSWLYASALKRDRSSLDALALGEFPLLDVDSRLH